MFNNEIIFNKDHPKSFMKKCPCGFSHKFLYNSLFNKYFVWCNHCNNYYMTDSKEGNIC